LTRTRNFIGISYSVKNYNYVDVNVSSFLHQINGELTGFDGNEFFGEEYQPKEEKFAEFYESVISEDSFKKAPSREIPLIVKDYAMARSYIESEDLSEEEVDKLLELAKKHFSHKSLGEKKDGCIICGDENALASAAGVKMCLWCYKKLRFLEKNEELKRALKRIEGEEEKMKVASEHVKKLKKGLVEEPYKSPFIAGVLFNNPEKGYYPCFVNSGKLVHRFQGHKIYSSNKDFFEKKYPGKSYSELEVHHIDNNHLNFALDNLAVISKEEHDKIKHKNIANREAGLKELGSAGIEASYIENST